MQGQPSPQTYLQQSQTWNLCQEDGRPPWQGCSVRLPWPSAVGLSVKLTLMGLACGKPR